MTAAAHEKIAILGGGTGALTAAFALTDRPDLREKYDITVYQMGWRLGGKGASGRNAAAGQRIEEHGLHVWGGFYENAFRIIRKCYAELGRKPEEPLATWQDAFKPHSYITVEEFVASQWIHWNVQVATNYSLPGDGSSLPTIWDYVCMTLEWMLEIFGISQHLDGEPAHHPTWHDFLHRLVTGAASLSEIPDLLEQTLPAVSKAFLLHVALRLSQALPKDPSKHPDDHHHFLRWILDSFLKRLRADLEDLVTKDDHARRLFLLLDLAGTHVRGLIADQVITKGFDIIDDCEWTDWLRKHGASEMTLDSPMVRGTYSYVFGFRKGNTDQRCLAAGTCIRGLLRLMFSYKGAIFWEMQAGMGDTVFAPLYLVLQKRGVKFKYFHRVKKLSLSADKQSVASIELGRQATVKAGDYQPLVDVKGLPCWPSTPLYEQLQEGPALRDKGIDLESAWAPWPDVETINLQVGQDFDRIVLGISLGALPHICADLIAASPAWQRMVAQVDTVQTQALQLWLKPDAATLGWTGPPTILTAYVEPLDTWADMSHLIQREDWQHPEQPRNIAYFCGALDDQDPIPPFSQTDFPAKESSRVKQSAINWLTTNIGRLLTAPPPLPEPSQRSGCLSLLTFGWLRRRKPAAASVPATKIELSWDHLVDPKGGSGLARFEAQYWRANVNPSDRYVLSVPGSVQHRLRANESGFSNLVLAGDWVRTGLNAGCVEAAVQAGLQASRAICDYPREIVGEHDLFERPPHVEPHRARPLHPEQAPARPAKPAYIERGGEQVFLQPLKLEGVRFYSFLLTADATALQAACDKYLNGPAQGHVEYRLLVPRILLGFADIRRASCLNKPDSDKGWMTEIDVAFWVPVVAGRRIGGVFFAERLAWFLPYVWVDNEWAVASGREIYGFPKELGQFQVPQGPDDPSLFTADTFVLDPYHPDTQAQTRRLLEVQRVPDATGGGLAKTWANLRDAFEDFLHLLTGGSPLELPGLELPLEILKFVTRHEVPMAFLKEFRDVADGRNACYQAVVEAPARLLKFHRGGHLPGEYRVKVNEYATHPLISELGLGAAEQTALAAWYTEFDFVMENGKEIWRTT